MQMNGTRANTSAGHLSINHSQALHFPVFKPSPVSPPWSRNCPVGNVSPPDKGVSGKRQGRAASSF